MGSWEGEGLPTRQKTQSSSRWRQPTALKDGDESDGAI